MMVSSGVVAGAASVAPASANAWNVNVNAYRLVFMYETRSFLGGVDHIVRGTFQRPYKPTISVSASEFAFTLKPMEAAVASAGKSSFGTFNAYSRKW
jgi:hypothetical protein